MYTQCQNTINHQKTGLRIYLKWSNLQRSACRNDKAIHQLEYRLHQVGDHWKWTNKKFGTYRNSFLMKQHSHSSMSPEIFPLLQYDYFQLPGSHGLILKLFLYPFKSMNWKLFGKQQSIATNQNQVLCNNNNCIQVALHYHPTEIDKGRPRKKWHWSWNR